MMTANNPKLDAAKAVAIRQSNDSLATLAKRYGVCRSTIKFVKDGKTWC